MTMTPTEDESPLATEELDFVPATSATKTRSGRAPDYRLRGLDLDAPALAEAPARTVRKRHPSYRRRRRRHVVQWVVALGGRRAGRGVPPRRRSSSPTP